jgi:hypothetical protein
MDERTSRGRHNREHAGKISFLDPFGAGHPAGQQEKGPIRSQTRQRLCSRNQCKILPRR